MLPRRVLSKLLLGNVIRYLSNKVVSSRKKNYYETKVFVFCQSDVILVGLLKFGGFV
jgi:hypothetical protein